MRHLLLVLLVSWPLGGCGSEPPRSELPPALAEERPVEVQATLAQRGSIRQKVSAPGSLVARRESRIGAQVRGRIERIHVDEGDRVESGELLFEIDAEPYRIGLRQAAAGVDLARSELAQLEMDLARARALLERHVVSEQDIDRLETSVAVARARESQAQEAVGLARQQLAYTRVRAPYAGSVAQRLADEGTTALVQPQTIVVVLQETSLLEARAAIPESELSRIQIGDRALVHVEGVSGPLESQVSMVSDTIDHATRTYLVKISVPNPRHELKAGLFAHVEILPREKADVLVVPRESLRTEEGRSRVLAVREGRAVAVPVQVGLVSEDRAEVLSGLAEGEKVIVGDSARRIAPGMRVRVVESPEASS